MHAGQKSDGRCGEAPTFAVLPLPAWSPDSRKVVLPLTEPVTRPLCLLMRSVASSRHIDSSTPVITKVLPVRHSGWPLGSSCRQREGLGSCSDSCVHSCRPPRQPELVFWQTFMRENEPMKARRDSLMRELYICSTKISHAAV